MVVNAKEYLKVCHEVLNEIYETQHENIEHAAMLLADAVEQGGVLHIFGTGHSKEVGVEMANRLGSLLALHPIDMNDMMYKGGVSTEVFFSHDDIYERKAGVSDAFLNLYDIQKEDLFLLVSNSGINGIIIDIAKKAKELGNKIIVITSMKHSTIEESRHPSGTKLYEYADVILDNCGPHGDAIMETEEGNKIVAVSSFADDLLCDSLNIKAIEYLLNRGLNPPVYTEDIEHNKVLRALYQNRI